MKPSPQFMQMIAMLFNSRQSIVSNDDLIKHKDNKTTFYPISKMTFQNGNIISQTQPFSDSVIMEIEKGCDNIHLISENSTINYRRISPVEFETNQGKGMLHWNVEDQNQQIFIVVKLMSQDGCVQIKFITADGITQIIYNVCELPSHLAP